MNLFIIGSPLQLINASEAKYQLAIPEDESYLIVINFFGEKNLMQLKQTLELYKWRNILFFNYLVKNKVSQLFKIRAIIIQVTNKFKRNAVSQVFVGEYNAYEIRAVANKFNHAKTFLLDDGNGSIDVANKRLNNAGAVTPISLRYFIYRSFGLNVREYKTINFFTFYSYLFQNKVRQISVIKNNLDLTRSLNQSKKQGDEIYFLGNKFVEKDYISYGQYKDQLEFAINYIKKNIGENITYFPHRGEGLDKLKKIQEDLDLKIQNIDLPIELYLLRDSSRPLLVTTFFSSAINSISNLFGNEISLLSFYINPSKFKILSSKVVANIYKDYDKNNIKVVKKN